MRTDFGSVPSLPRRAERQRAKWPSFRLETETARSSLDRSRLPEPGWHRQTVVAKEENKNMT
jgi:hypothetical protein